MKTYLFNLTKLKRDFMKKKITWFVTFLLIGIGLSNAQISQVTGNVTSDEDGLPVVGASVLVRVRL